MRGIQRIISGWLALCLVLSMLPMQVFAVEETVMEPVETTEIGTETASESTTDEDVATTVETTVGTTAASEKAETTEEATVAETETVAETTDTLPAETVFETEATVPNTVETTEATEPVVETTVAEEVIEETIAEDAEGAVTDSDEQERTVASDFAWTYDEKRHKLTISGNGDMPSWEAYEDAPWFSLDYALVEISEGITSIGSFAFAYDYYGLGEFTEPYFIIPESITKISNNAFFGNAAKIRFRGDAPEFDAAAFDAAVQISVYYPENNGTWTSDIQSLYGADQTDWNCAYTSGTYEGDASWSYDDTTGVLTLSGADMPEFFPMLPEWNVFFSGTISAVQMEDGIPKIEACAFQDCYSLKTISIPDSVTAIESDAFRKCYSLEELKLPESIEELGCAFYRCDNLSLVKFTGNAPIFDEYTFLGNTLTAYYPACNSTWTTDVMQNYSGTITWEPRHAYVYREVDATCTEDGMISRVCEDCGDCYYAYIVEASGHNYVDNVCKYCGAGYEACGDDLGWTLEDGVLTISGTGDMAVYGDIVHSPWYDYKEDITSVVIENGVTSIGSYAFSYCNGLTDLTIPESVTSIGDHAFWGCSSLTDLTIPESVTSIGDFAFRGCSSLTSITIPEGVTSIGHWVFDGCSRLSVITIPESVTSIGTRAFWGCRSLTGIVIPESVTSIDASAFNGCSSLTSITIPKGVTSIGDSAFDGCSNLTSVTITDGVKSIGNFAFSRCSSLTGIIIPGSVTSIGSSAFDGCSNLTSVTIMDGVTSIGDHAFNGCSNLTSIIIPESVTNIGSNAFWKCNNLTSITIPESVTQIGSCAFAYIGGLKEIYFIGDACSIGSNSFIGVTATAYYPAGNATWTEEVMQDYGGDITWVPYEGEHVHEYDSNHECECGAVGGTCGDDVAWELENGVLTISGIGAMTDYSNSWNVPWRDKTVETVVIQFGVTTISRYAFYSCDDLKTIEIPDSVINIGTYAFNGCNSLEIIEIPASVTQIAYNAFYGCAGLTKIIVDSDNANYCSDESGVLFNMNQERLIKAPAKLADGYVIPETVAAIESYAFSRCKELNEIVIPGNVEQIGTSAFEYCSNLSKVELQTGVRTIGNSSFSQCEKMKEITIPNTVTSIGQSAFSSCNFTSVTIPSNVESIGKGAFYSQRLTAIWVNEENTFFSNDEKGALLNKDKTSLIMVPGGITGEYTVPDTVTYIEESAFVGYGTLTRINIPASVAVLGSDPFPSAHDCLTIVFYGDAPEITEVFDSWGSEGITVQYPADNETWTEEVKAAFGGDVFWLPVDFNQGTSGSCGENLTWALEQETGTLTITGTGDMDSWDGTTGFAPWLAYGDMIRKVVIEDGVTSIGDHAFIRTNVEEICFNGDAPEIGNNIQSTSYSSVACYYDPTKDGWNETIASNPHFQWIPNSTTAYKSLQEIVEASDTMTADEIRAAVQALDYEVLLSGMRSGDWLADLDTLEMLVGEYPDMEIDKAVPVLSKHSTTFLSRTGLNLNNLIDPNAPTKILLSTSTKQIAIPDGYKEERTIPFSLSFENVQNSETLDVPVQISLYLEDAPFFWDVYWYNNATKGVEKIPTRVTWQKVNGLHLRFVVTGSGDYVAVPKENGVISGTCGENLTWTFNDAGNLSISGSGAMYHYGETSNVSPWYYYREAVETITIGDQVTSIGSYAFNDCRFVNDIKVPANVTNIGEGAFYGLDEVAVIFEGNAPAFDERAFLGWDYNAYYPAGNDTWTDVIQNTYGSEYGFDWIPYGLTGTCGENAVWSFDEVTGTLTISGTGAMNDFDFYGDEIAPWFVYGPQIKKVVIEEGITTIGMCAFYECNNLAEVEIADTVEIISDSVFLSEKLTEITIPAGVKVISEMSGIASVERIEVVDDNETFSSVDGVLFNKDQTTLVLYPRKNGAYTVPEGVTRIGDWAFSSSNNLTAISLPGTLTSIGQWAFSSCSALPEITIPDSVTVIKEWAFENCTGLQEITIGSGVKSIGQGAFSYTRLLNKIVFSGDAPTYEEDVFEEVVATAYYPANNATWTEAVMQDYCGDITWKPYCTGEHTFVNGKCTVCGEVLSAPVVTISNRAESGKPMLKWDAISGANGYDIYRATSASGTYTKLYTTKNTSYTNTSAKVGSTYYYKVVATFANGAVSPESNVVSTTCDLPRPEVTASNVYSSGKIKLSWEAVSGATKYYIYRSESLTGEYKYIYSTSKTSFTNSSVEAGKTYYYKVKAVHSTAAATSAHSAAVETICKLPRPVVEISNSASSGKITLTWEPVEGAEKYWIFRSESKDGTYKYLYSTTKTSFVNTGAEAGKTYYYRVRAIHSNTKANSYRSLAVGTMCDLARPVVTITNSAVSGKPVLSWNAISGAVKYEIYRSTTKDGTYKYLYSTTKTTYTNTSAVAGKTYYYRVKAIHSDAEANSALSYVKSRTCDLATPKVTITLSASGKPSLKWEAVSGTVKYYIYRAEGEDGEYKFYTSTSKTSYVNSKAEAGKTYSYQVRAVISSSSAANSAYSNSVSIQAK